jgi:hypothetical protein
MASGITVTSFSSVHLIACTSPAMVTTPRDLRCGSTRRQHWACAVPATLGKRKHICNTSPRLRLSMWFAVWHGSMAFPALRLGVPLLLASMMRLERVRHRYRNRGNSNYLSVSLAPDPIFPLSFLASAAILHGKRMHNHGAYQSLPEITRTSDQFSQASFEHDLFLYHAADPSGSSPEAQR